MKTALAFFCFIFFTYLGFSQDASSLKAVTITFRNNSSLSKCFSFVSYAPDEDGNATIQTILKPFA